MRKLTDKETELTQKGINKLQEELEFLKKTVEYSKDVASKNKIVIDFEAKWKPWLNQIKLEEDDRTIKDYETEIEMKENSIKQMLKHIEEGVEEKTPQGVG